MQIKNSCRSGVKTHACNPSTWHEDYPKYGPSLDYIGSTKAARATKQHNTTKQTNKQPMINKSNIAIKAEK